MNRGASLDQYFNEFFPGFNLKEWTTDNKDLSDATAAFLSDPATLDHQCQYLAENIVLDSFNSRCVEKGIEAYLKRYLSQNYPNDQARKDSLDRLCKDAIKNQPNSQSQNLCKLLSDQCEIETAKGGNRTQTLNEMKRVQTATRFGDVVYLPHDADIVVVGDTHGDLASTRRIISEIETSALLDSGGYVVFLGDYTNNGVRSWQNLVEILSFKNKYPDAVVLLSGNHEFKESYLTALNEYFNVHWNHFIAEQLPENLRNRLPEFDNHYGHLRLELIRCFGVEEGERIYSLCAEWGMSLPYVCISKNLMISHSLGARKNSALALTDLYYGKQQDVENIKRLGYEVWQARRASLHCNLINNRDISAALLSEFNRVLGVNQFVVGHCHYRSGDTLRFGHNAVTTIVSSDPFSPDSGHYMYQQMMIERKIKSHAENLCPKDAFAGYLQFTAGSDGSRPMHIFTVNTASK